MRRERTKRVSAVDDQLTVGLASQLQPERGLRQVGIVDDLPLLVHDPTAVGATEDQPALGDFGEQGGRLLEQTDFESRRWAERCCS